MLLFLFPCAVDEAELIEAELLFAQMQALSEKTSGLDKHAFLSHFPLPGMLGDRCHQ